MSTQRIILYLGLNFYLEFTLDEALSFIEKKKQLLNSENDKLIKKSCEIKANIKLVLDVSVVIGGGGGRARSLLETL